MNTNPLNQSNGSGVGKFLRNHANSKGKSFVELPRHENSDSTVTLLPTKGGWVVHDASDGQIYTLADSHEPIHAQQPQPQQQKKPWEEPQQKWEPQSQPQSPEKSRGKPQPQPDKMDIDSGRQVPGPCFYNPMEICAKAPGPFQTSISRWTKNKREGLRVFTPEEVERFDPPISPLRINADECFNDELWNSLQSDVLPPGCNAVDDYLRLHNLTRHRIFMDAVIGNQGCSCECDKTPLDNYLQRHRNVCSAIGLRAAVSEHCKSKMREPVETRPMKEMMVRMKAQAEQMMRDIDMMAGKPFPADGDPFNAMDEDDWMNVS